jgi:oligopeptide transport system substrate-binding protein
VEIATDFSSDQIDWLRKNLPKETRIAPYLGIYYYPINTSKPPFNDKRIRQAMSLAINREAITDKVLKSGEIPAYSFVPPGTPNYASGPSYMQWKQNSYKERLAQANKLMGEAGYGPDKPLKFTLSYNTSENHKRIAIAVAAMWKQIGVQAELFNSEVKVHYDALKSGDFQVGRAGWIADYPDPQNFLFLLEARSGTLNYGRYDNADFNGLMDKAGVTSDLEARAMLMAKAEAQAMEDQPVIPIYYYVSKNLVSQQVVGWVDNARDSHPVRFLDLK